MPKIFKFFHLIGFALLLGGVASHILLGQLALIEIDQDNFAKAAALRAHVYLIIQIMLLPGLALLWLTGLTGLARQKFRLLKSGWLRVKLILATLATANGVFILTPLASELAVLSARAMASGRMPTVYGEVLAREDFFGTLNLLLLLSACLLACYKPRSGKRKHPKHSTEHKLEHITAP